MNDPDAVFQTLNYVRLVCIKESNEEYLWRSCWKELSMQNSKAINHNLVEAKIFYAIKSKFYLNVTDSMFSLFDCILPSFSNDFFLLATYE